MKGTIVKLFLNKGYGFIRCVQGKSYFLHATQVNPPEHFDRLSLGVPVEFDAIVDTSELAKGNGLKAANVRAKLSAD